MVRIWGRVEREQSLISSFLMLSSFCFYLPLGIMGPLVTSKKFKDSHERAAPPLSLRLVSDAVLGVLRYCFWIMVTDVSTYFIYEQALTHHVRMMNIVVDSEIFVLSQPHLVDSLSLWSLCGLGYALGQFFHLKYVVMYGISGQYQDPSPLNAD